MSCGCERQRGLGRLRGGILCSGSTFRVGFQLSFSVIASVSNDFSEAVEGCLYDTGYFESVQITVTPGTFYVYVLVRGVTSGDFGDKEDVGALVAGVINQCGGQTISRRDPVQVDAIPAGASERGCQAIVATDAVGTTPAGANKGIYDTLFPKTGNSSGLLIVAGLGVVLLLALKK